MWISNKVNLLLTQKWEENIPKFYFCIRAPMFLAHMPQLFIINICFTNKVNTICAGGQLLVSGSRVLESHVPVSHVPRVSDLGSRVPGLRISGPDFRLCHFPINIAKSFKTAFFIEHLQWLLVLFGTSFFLSTDWKVSVFGVCLALIFPAFGLNAEIYFVNLRIKSQCKKLRTSKIQNADFFLLFYLCG